MKTFITVNCPWSSLSLLAKINLDINGLELHSLKFPKKKTTNKQGKVYTCIEYTKLGNGSIKMSWNKEKCSLEITVYNKSKGKPLIAGYFINYLFSCYSEEVSSIFIERS
jgi:hypothetical protein